MSFSSEQKNRIISDIYKNPCCRKALLCGILSYRSTVNKDEITVILEKSEYCEFCAKLVFEFYGTEASVSSPEKGGRCKILRFKSKAAAKFLLSLGKGNLFLQKCQNCRSAYFKGVFLACGTISDPQKQYLLEFSPSQNEVLLIDLLSENSFFFKSALRNSKKVFYLKRASEIEDFCGFVGLTDAMFDITNAQIEREFLNNTNRIVNCETNNIEKSVSASGKQIEAIKLLIEHNLLSNLPEELEYTARLRIQNESLSLSQLSKLFIPPISKSGLSHRLTKIIEITEQLLSDKN